MKKLLSMLLVVAMVLGLGIPAFAADDAASKAADQAKILGLIVGNEYGDQQLDKALTRQEMAVIMYALYNGGKRMDDATLKTWNQNANILTAVVKDMADVASWAKPYVAWTWSNNVFAGNGQGYFNPKANLSVVECAVLMLRALGADEVIHAGCATPDVNCKWNENTILTGMAIELFADVASIDYTKAITRSDIAVMLENMLATNSYDDAADTFTGAKAMQGYYGAADLAGLKKTELFVKTQVNNNGTPDKAEDDFIELVTADAEVIKAAGNFNADMLYKEYSWYQSGNTVLTAPEQTTGWTTLIGEKSTLKAEAAWAEDAKTNAIATLKLGNGSYTFEKKALAASSNVDFTIAAYYLYTNMAVVPAVSADLAVVNVAAAADKKLTATAFSLADINDDDTVIIYCNKDNILVLTAKTYYGWIKSTTTDGVTTLSDVDAPGENVSFCKYTYDANGAIKVLDTIEGKSVANYAITGTVNNSSEYTLKYGETTLVFPDTNVDAWNVTLGGTKAAYVYNNLISETGVVDSKNAYVYIDGNKLVGVELRTPTAETPIVQTYYYGYTAPTSTDLAIQYLLNVTTGEFVDFNNFKVSGVELSTITSSGFYTNTNGATVSDSDKDLVLVATSGNAPVNVTQYLGGEYAGKIWVGGAEKAVGNEKNKYNIVCVDTELKTLLNGEDAKQVAILVTAADANTIGKYVVYDVVKASKAPTATSAFYYISDYTTSKNADGKTSVTVNAIDVKNIANVTLNYADITKVTGLQTGLVKVTNNVDGTYTIAPAAESTGWTTLGNVTQYIGGTTYGNKVWIGGVEYTIVDAYAQAGNSVAANDKVLANKYIVLNGDALTQLLAGSEVKQVVITNGKTDKDAVAVVVAADMVAKLVYVAP